MVPPFDLIIIGAGVVGAAAAREAARRGLRVAVVEAASAGSGVTAAAMGHVVVMDDSPAQLALSRYSRQLWLDEEPSLPSAVEYESRGTIWVAADDEELLECRNKADSYQAAGVTAEVLSATDLEEQEPNLRKGLAGGLLVPHDGVCYPPVAAAHFLAQAIHAGARHHVGRVLSANQGRVTLADGTHLLAPSIVLATGADTSLLPNLPIQRRKGHLVITERYAGFAHHQLLELGYLKSAHGDAAESVAFNLQPRRTGQMLIGSSRQFGREVPEAESAILARMLRRAIEYMPAIDKLTVLRVWTGFRAATADKLPLIGPATPLSEDPSLWLLMGFEGLGITNALGAAKLLVSGLLAEPAAISSAPFDPSRLASPSELAYA